MDRMSETSSRRDALRALASALAVGVLPRVSRAAGARGARDAARPYLDVARATARWLGATARDDVGGVSWYWDPADAKPEVQTNLYSGTAGVVLFFVELHAATGEGAHRELALRAADYLVATLPSEVKGDEAGLYGGIAGVAWTLATVGRVLRSAPHREASERAYAVLARAAAPTGAGIAWNESNDIIAGSAGIGLVLLDRARNNRDASVMEQAMRAGDRLLEVGVTGLNGGLTWDLSPSVPRRYPNFSHGAAGVGYFLAQLHGRTRERRFLDGALGAARYLESIAERTPGGGQRVFHHTPGGESLYYLSWCHGPAGTARLYEALAVATGDASHRRTIGELAQATVDSRVPERSEGYWNNVSCCCGNCGVSDFYVAMATALGESRYLALAQQMADDTIARASGGSDGMRWVQAENRVSPNDLRAQTGMMQGAAGVGLSMLRLDAALNRRGRVVVLPGDPWGE